MRRVLLTGMSGAGKSTVTRALVELGFKAIDADDGLTEPLPNGRQRWREEAVQEVLDTDDAPVLFLAGCEDNMIGFVPRFDVVILLSAPVDVLVERVVTRPTNPYGKRPGDLDRILRDVELVEPELRKVADHVVSTTQPVTDVLSDVLRVAGVDPP